jgi:predicted RNase H-like HicB family nuclease
MQPWFGMAISVLVAVKEKNGMFLARCPFLNIVSQGATEEKAIEQIQKEMAFLFSVCAADGTLEALLDKRTAVEREPFPPDDLVRVSKTYVDLPPNIPPELLKRFADAAASAD